MPGFNADLYQKYHKIWPTGFAKVAVQSVQAVLLPLSNNSSFKPREPQSFGTAVFLSELLIIEKQSVAKIENIASLFFQL